MKAHYKLIYFERCVTLVVSWFIVDTCNGKVSMRGIEVEKLRNMSVDGIEPILDREGKILLRVTYVFGVARSIEVYSTNASYDSGGKFITVRYSNGGVINYMCTESYIVRETIRRAFRINKMVSLLSLQFAVGSADISIIDYTATCMRNDCNIKYRAESSSTRRIESVSKNYIYRMHTTVRVSKWYLHVMEELMRIFTGGVFSVSCSPVSYSGIHCVDIREIGNNVCSNTEEYAIKACAIVLGINIESFNAEGHDDKEE